MARIPLAPPRTLFHRVDAWCSKPAYQEVLDTVKALGHNMRALRADLRFEQAVSKWERP
ncbi:hypothetical protein [Streptomyces sp. NPDC002133]|uniref:hypothetical protein n=1 Tax=Streptomyces sp. NPDC002133 TaxID=3154409 RepID=UPI003329F3E8